MADETPTAGAEGERRPYVLHLPRLERLLRSCLPEETVDHLKAGRREDLLAARTLLDAMLQRLEGGAEESKGPRRVEIKLD